MMVVNINWSLRKKPTGIIAERGVLKKSTKFKEKEPVMGYFLVVFFQRCSYLAHMCDALRDLVPFVQFEKREKRPWRSLTVSKVAGFSPKLYYK